MFSIPLAKDSLRTLWAHKYLWVFGLFAAAGAGSGAGGTPGGASGPHGASLPTWLLPVLAGVALIALLSAVLHVVSEGALIDSVWRNHDREPHSFSSGVRAGLRHFWRMLGVKLLLALAYIASALLIVVPPVLMAVKLIPLWAGLALTVPLALAAVPWFLTLYFITMFATRFVVVEERSVIDAIRGAHRFLHGRIVTSIELLLTEAVARVAGSALGALVVLLVGGAIALGLYFAFGTIPALVGLGVVALPVALVLGGAMGAFGSSLWTLAFLEQRAC